MSRRRFRQLLIALALLLATAGPASAQVPLGSIIGIIRIVRGSFPPDRILVTLQLHGAAIISSYADDEGRFSFNALASNIYTVVINDDRYTRYEMRVDVNPLISPTNVLQVMLSPIPTKSAAVDTQAPNQYVISTAELAKTFPKNAVKELERGLKLNGEGKTDDAIGHYEKAIKEAPDFALAHSTLGAAYLSKSDFPKAQKEFAEAIRLNPSDAGAYFNMANLMLLTGDLEQARRNLQEGFRFQPDSAFGTFVQGSVFERSGNLTEAERALRRALDLDPKLARPHLELVNLYLREQRPADAIPELKKFLQVAPQDPLAPKAREVLERLQAGSKQSSRH